MALFPKTPGVYVEEVSTLPPSVPPVATAVPAFIGYTAVDPGQPVRIKSMMEYINYFGGAYDEGLTVSITGTYPAVSSYSISPSPGALSDYVLYYSMQMYFANGGGTCWVISAGDYAATFDGATLNAAIDAAEQVDEITLLLCPDSINLSVADRKLVNDYMLAQCAKLQDRFTIIDVKELGGSIYDDANQLVNGFRTGAVGVNNLKYGAAYYPRLNTTLSVDYNPGNVVLNVTGWAGAPAEFTTLNDSPNGFLSVLKNGMFAFGTYTVTTISDSDTFTVDTKTYTAKNSITGSDQFLVGNGTTDAISNLIDIINNDTVINSVVRAELIGSNVIRIVARASGASGNAIALTESAAGVVVFPGTGTLQDVVNNAASTQLYSDVIAEFNSDYRMKLYPAAAMAGIYTLVDNTRGVWHAPANVSLAAVESLGKVIDNSDQENLNVDVSGKSINAIRNFVGRGNLVWGARTLDGNSNEWRYVNVRRLFIMAEESCKKASAFVVFEPNDKNTWNRVKGMISNFLTTLWRDGALVGDKPEQAFFVKVGLNETMTAQDILEGRMIVEIGMAAVRPAEFIILRFSHKLQEA
ncbi:MAG: phage tail sheath family protein [Bacteroidia bacterium]|nr:phage tail sheath family protein [Bacteroidia bacterium]